MEDLINRLVAGSAEAWDEFVDRFSRLIYKVFWTKSFGFSRDEIDELFNDFVVDMLKDDYRKVRLFEGRNQCSFPSYLKKIAINMAIDRKKKHIRNRMISLNVTWGGHDEDGCAMIDFVDSGEQDPNSLMLDREESLQFQDTLYMLDPGKLLVVLLIVYHQYDRVMLGKLLSTSRQNIDVIFNRSKNRLIKLFEAEKKAINKKDLIREPTPWRESLHECANFLDLEDRSFLLKRCLHRLSIPQEMLIGVVFINGRALNPTPERIVKVLKSDIDATQQDVEKVLRKIIE